MIRSIGGLAAFLLLGSLASAGELDAEYGPKAAPKRVGMGPAKAPIAQVATKSSELDAEGPAQSWGHHGYGGGFHGGYGGYGYGRGFGYGYGYPRYGYGYGGFGLGLGLGLGVGYGLGYGYGGYGYGGYGYGGYGYGGYGVYGGGYGYGYPVSYGYRPYY